MKIIINIPMPAKEYPESFKCPSVEDKVRHLLDLIDTEYSTPADWETLRRLFNMLNAVKKPNKRQKNLIELIKPVMEKYGYSDSAGVSIGEQGNG